jgi:4-phospho-D-threonate 3-dehydrogenase / 4-phospho-D-erythronate 3-dehydrogenase
VAPAEFVGPGSSREAFLSSVSDQRPVIAFTVGDVAGVGPELLAISLLRPETYAACRPIVIGPAGVLTERADQLGLSLRFKTIAKPNGASFEPGYVDVVEPAGIPPREGHGLGEVNVWAWKISGLCLGEAFRLAADGSVDGVVGAPINKEAFRLAGYDYVDEITFLTDVTGSPEPRLFGVLGDLWTTCVTLHVAFRDIAQTVKRDRVLEAIKAMHIVLDNAGTGSAAIAVAALNPHNGEGGLLGREEIDEIAPAVRDALDLGIDASGPYPADTIFPRALAGNLPGVVCMYHDQANIARKLRGFKDSASAFIGLPVPYATTAHGTAFDLVGTGKVDPSSFQAALRFVVGQCQSIDNGRP